METAFSVNHVDVIWLELHDPSSVQGRRVLHLHQGLQGGMISDHLEGSSFEVMPVMFHSPHNCKLLKLCCTIISNSSSYRSTGITDDSFTVDLFAFSVEFTPDREILCEDSSQSITTCICVQLEGSLHGWPGQDGGGAEFVLENFECGLGLVCPFEGEIFLQSSIDRFSNC